MNTQETIEYFHVCFFCNKHWWDKDKASYCPKCSRQHVWFRGTSRLAEPEPAKAVQK
jgi:hypothetical protein